MSVLSDAETLLSLCSTVSALVSNPPYLFSEDMTSLDPEISRWIYKHLNKKNEAHKNRIFFYLPTFWPTKTDGTNFKEAGVERNVLHADWVHSVTDG